MPRSSAGSDPSECPPPRGGRTIFPPDPRSSHMMKRTLLSALSVLSLLAASTARAQQPLYLVNGRERADVADIPPSIIERIEELPADEESIARYGEKAACGVVLVTLRYDEAPRFTADTLPFDRYVARRVTWNETDPAARVVLRYRIDETGALTVSEVLEATDSRFRRRVLKALEGTPRWEPARKAGTPVVSEGVLRIQLPEGKRLPRRPELVWR